MIRNIAIASLLILSQCLATVRAAECDLDEICKPLEECEEEMKLYRSGQRDMLKVCGVKIKTSDHCCKISSPREVTDRVSNELLINSKHCGKTSYDRIFGGKKASVNQFPWLVLLEYKLKKDNNTKGFDCAGTLISKRYVLTAAHCVLDSESSKYKLFSVRLGEHTISTDKDCVDKDDLSSCNPPVEDIPVEKVIVHEGYSSAMLSNDIALIRLSRDVELSKEKRHIKTICLPVDISQQIDKVDPMLQNLQIAGWGITENHTTSDFLLTATIPYVRQDICVLQYKDYEKENSHRKFKAINIQDTQMCAGGELGVDTAEGDSGSALMGVAMFNSKPHFFQYGITSFGLRAAENATKAYPGVYTRVEKYITWILENMTKE